MRQVGYEKLVRLFLDNPGADLVLAHIYCTVCRAPHIPAPTTRQLHSRCARALGRTRTALSAHGYVLVPGALRGSYRAVPEAEAPARKR